MHYFNCKQLIPALLMPFLLFSCGKKQETILPQRTEIAEAVYASGMLVPEQEYKIFANTDGILVQSLVIENDSFRKGQPLFRIETNTRKVQEGLLGNIYETARTRAGSESPALQELDIRIQTASSKKTNDSLQFSRLDALLAKDAVAKSEWERAKLQWDASRNEWIGLQTQKENILLQSKMESQQAENQYRTLQAQNKDGLVTGAMDGVIFEIFKKNGERVNINEPIALGGMKDNWIARLTIDERDFSRVKEGQAIFIQLDAFPGKTFRAKISRILPKLNRAEQSFYAEAVFDEPLQKGIYGLNLEANILIDSKSSVLTIPRQALQNGDSLNIKRKGTDTTIHVVTGIRNVDRVEIVEGLLEDDEIILK